MTAMSRRLGSSRSRPSSSSPAAAGAGAARADGPTPIPPAPTEFVTDRAGFLSPAARVRSCRASWKNYERGTGHQVIVSIEQDDRRRANRRLGLRRARLQSLGRRAQGPRRRRRSLRLQRRSQAAGIEVGYGVDGPPTRRARGPDHPRTTWCRASAPAIATAPCRRASTRCSRPSGARPSPRRPADASTVAALGVSSFQVLFFIIVGSWSRCDGIRWVWLFLGSGRRRRRLGRRRWLGRRRRWIFGGGGGFSGGGGSSGGGGASGGW